MSAQRILNTAFLLVAFFFIPHLLDAQELNCNVSVIAPQVQLSNKQILSSMEQSIREFMNNRKWTNDVYQPFEKIDCNILVTITGNTGNDYSATIQVQASRPVYGASYKTSAFRFLDKTYNFTYIESQSLEYQEGIYQNEFTAVLGYYANLILGFDYDSFSENGGSQFFQRALSMVNSAQSVGSAGWSTSDKTQRNRYFLINDIMDDRHRDFRKAWYVYHRMGLDQMAQDNLKGRENLMQSISTLYGLYKANGSLLELKIFFDLKGKELSDLFQDASSGQKEEAKKMLSQMDPTNADKFYDWQH